MEHNLKKYNKFVAALFTVIIGGCASTDSNIISERGNVVKYKSRCGVHQVDNTIKSTRDAFIPTQDAQYPRRAARNGMEGYVKLEYDVSAQGAPIRVNVVESYPSDVFNEAALISFADWRYAPKTSECQLIQLDFNLN